MIIEKKTCLRLFYRLFAVSFIINKKYGFNGDAGLSYGTGALTKSKADLPTRLGSWAKWGENIFAGYLNFIHEKPKFDIEAGVRAELTDVFYNIDPANI